MAVKLNRKKVIRVALETTSGTAATTVATECLVYDPVIQPTHPVEQRLPAYPFGGTYKKFLGERTGRLTFSTELRGDGSAGFDVGLLALIQACGLKALATPTRYQPTTTITDQKTLTVHVFEDGLKKGLYGAMGNVNFTGTFGKRLMMEFDFQGKWLVPTDVALPTPTHTAQLPCVLRSCALTLGGLSPKVSRFSINLNNVVEPRQDISDATGIAHYVITDRAIAVGMDPEVELVATYDFHGLWLAGTTGALSAVVGNGTDGFTFAAPAVEAQQVNTATRELKQVFDYIGQCNTSTSGDDELVITPGAA